jgi:hypothetical protein
MVMIEVEVDIEDSEDIYGDAGHEAGEAISEHLHAAGLDFDFCDDWSVYDEDGNEVEESV